MYVQSNTSAVSVTNNSKDLDLSSTPEDIAKAFRENNAQDNPLDHLIVDCQNFNEISDTFLEGISEFIEESTSLIKLNVLLRRTTHLTNDSLLLLGSSISTLESLQELHLSFANCDGMTSEGIKNLSIGIAAAENILDLSLSFRYCEWMSDECMFEICEKSIKSKSNKLLKLKLDCEYCFEITDESAKWIGDSLAVCQQINCASLQIGSTNISDKGIAIIGESFFPVTETSKSHLCNKSFQLDVQGCENFTDQGVIQLSNQIKKFQSFLRYLSISIGSNNTISNSSLEKLISTMKSIRQSSLHLCSLPLLTAEIIQEQHLVLIPKLNQNSDGSILTNEITVSISKCLGIKSDELFQNIHKLTQFIKDKDTQVSDFQPSKNVIILDLKDQPLPSSQDASLFDCEKIKVIVSGSYQSKSNLTINQQKPETEPLKENCPEKVQGGGALQSKNSQNIMFVQFSNNAQSKCSQSGQIIMMQTKIPSSQVSDCLEINLCNENIHLQLNTLEKCFKQKILSNEQYKSVSIEEHKSQNDNQLEEITHDSEDNTVSLENLLLKLFSGKKNYERILIELLGKHSYCICDMTLAAISSAKSKHYQIKLANCQDVSDQGFKQLLTSMTSAETIHLNLFDCSNLSDTSMVLINNIIQQKNNTNDCKEYSSLRYLEITISKSDLITDSSLVALRDSIRKIEVSQIHLAIRLIECIKPSLKAMVGLDKAINKHNISLQH